MKHLKLQTGRMPALAMDETKMKDPCEGLTGLELSKCRKQNP